MRKSLVAALVVCLVPVSVSEAAFFRYQWEGGDPLPTVRIGEEITLEAYITLHACVIPSPDEMGFFLYVLSEFNFDAVRHGNRLTSTRVQCSSVRGQPKLDPSEGYR